MRERHLLQAMPEPMTRRQPNEEAETRPGGVAGIAGIVGAAVAVTAVMLVPLGWLSMAVSVLTPIGAPLDDIGEAARSANRTSTTDLSQPATPFPADGEPARDED
jgi:hypothetical protein